MNTLVRYNTWMLEQCLDLMGHRGQWTVVMDLKDLGFRAFDIRGMLYTRRLVQQDAEHYPERLGQAFIINTPGFIDFFWRRVKHWVDAKTRENVQLYGGPDTWRRPLGEV